MKAKRRDEFKVGLMVIIGMILFSSLLFWASRWQFDFGDQEIKIRFDFVGGLLKNAPVNMYGLEVGKVTSTKLMEDWVEVTARIDRKITVREGYRILIDMIGIVGEKYVEIINGPIGNPTTKDDPLLGTNPASIGRLLLEAGEVASKSIKTLSMAQNLLGTNEGEIRTGIAEIKNFILDVKYKIKRTMDNVDILLARANRFTEGKEGDIGQTITNLKALVEELNKDRENIIPVIQSVTEDLDQILYRSKPTIDSSLENLQKASKGLRDSTEKVSQYIEDLNKSASEIVAQLDKATESGDQKLQKLLDDFGGTTAELNQILDKIDKLVMEVENGHGTLGKLVKDEDSYKQLNETIADGKNAIENVNTIARNLDRKLKLFAGIDAKKEYELSYNNLSRSLQNRLGFSISQSNPYSYLAGLSVREGDLGYDLQAGRKFGNLMARVGFIRSKAGIGFDYWVLPNRAYVSLEGIDITSRQPEIDIDTAVRLFRDWYFIFGAEDLTGPEIGFNFGIKTIY